MQPVIIGGKPDNLDEVGQRFERPPITTPVFLNSVPKSGTHLIRNIMRMFVAPEQHWRREFIQHPILNRSLDAFSKERPFISWGHLLHSDEAAIALRDVRHIVLVRDPYDWVLARARFYLSDEFNGPLNNIKAGRAAIPDILNMMIFGVHQKAPSLRDMYEANAVAWLGGSAVLVRYEDLAGAVSDLGSRKAENFFRQLLADCGIETVPADWRERVEAGADRKESRTARENLTTSDEVPAVLSETHKRLVEFAAPGLRGLLGYS